MIIQWIDKDPFRARGWYRRWPTECRSAGPFRGLRARGEYQGADGRWRELANSARLGELLALTPKGAR